MYTRSFKESRRRIKIEGKGCEPNCECVLFRVVLQLTASTMRLLVAGDVEGNIKQLFTRIEGILKKSGPFEMLLCVGSFFANSEQTKLQWQSYVDGREKVPLPTYILGPGSLSEAPFYQSLGRDGGEMCPNLTCLGQRGLFKTSSGLQVVYVSGRYDRENFNTPATQESMSPYITADDVTGIESIIESKDNFRGVDILLTSDWPSGVATHTQPPEQLDMTCTGSEAVARLAVTVRPRYHFAGSMHRFYERTPYRNHEVLKDQQQHVTRFIALAQVGNPDKKNRYLYAFSITPLTDMDTKELVQAPPAVTNCPYTDLVNTKEEEGQEERGQQFFFDQKSLDIAEKKRRQQEGRRTGKRDRQDRGTPDAKRPALFPTPPSHSSQKPRGPPPAPRGPCWFCLGSPQVEKHLVITVGDHSYLALPKGGLVPDHVLILPIGHHSASTDTPQEVLDEMKRFRDALKKYCNSKDQSCVSFERNFKSQHLQIQVVPVPKAPVGALRQAFIDQGKALGLDFMEVDRDTPLTEVVPVGAPYFAAHFDEGPQLFVRIKGRFPLQFGREVLCSPLLLSAPERVDWRQCSVSKDEETRMAAQMRSNFQPFDFTDEL